MLIYVGHFIESISRTVWKQVDNPGSSSIITTKSDAWFLSTHVGKYISPAWTGEVWRSRERAARRLSIWMSDFLDDIVVSPRHEIEKHTAENWQTFEFLGGTWIVLVRCHSSFVVAASSFFLDVGVHQCTNSALRGRNATEDPTSSARRDVCADWSEQKTKPFEAPLGCLGLMSSPKLQSLTLIFYQKHIFKTLCFIENAFNLRITVGIVAA